MKAVGGYEGGTGQIETFRGGDGELFVKLYNDTGAAITNGYIYKIDWTDDADSKGHYPTPGTPATDTSGLTEIVVANNSPWGAATIADQAWGWFQKEGYCPTVIGNATAVTDEYTVKAADGLTTTAEDGAATTTSSFGICKGGIAAPAGSSGAVVLFGFPVVV